MTATTATTATTAPDPVALVPEKVPRPPWWLESLVLVWLLWAYDAISGLAPLRRGVALDHARRVWALEHHLHVAVESSLDHWLAAHHLLGLWLSDYYNNAHFVVTVGLVVWLWWRHPEHYRSLRTGLVLLNVAAFVIYWLYPMAPPRLVPGGRIADVVAVTHAFGSWHSGTLASVSNANQLAAMPSVHVAWALWSAWALWRVFRSRRGAALVWAYPALTTLVVLGTGNHFVVDVLAGVAVTVLAMVVADWSFSRRSLLPTNGRLPGPRGGSPRRPGRAGSGPGGDRMSPTTARRSATVPPRT